MRTYADTTKFGKKILIIGGSHGVHLSEVGTNILGGNIVKFLNDNILKNISDLD